MEILFATQNANKLSEIRKIVGDSSKIIGLNDLNYTFDLEETGDSIEANSLQKAEFIFNTFKMACFADDSGLLVECLNGEPGVHTAYFGGKPRSDQKNIEFLLHKMKSCQNRSASFVTVFTFKDHQTVKQFKGEVKGVITEDLRGTNGFGYDPIFIPEGFTISFAQMSAEEKNKISHRAIAFKHLAAFLLDNFSSQ